MAFFSKSKEPPENIFEASLRKDSEQWATAAKSGLKSLQKFGLYEVVKVPAEHQVFSKKFVVSKKYLLKTNSERYKSRLVIKILELNDSFGETFAPISYLDPGCVTICDRLLFIYVLPWLLDISQN